MELGDGREFSNIYSEEKTSEVKDELVGSNGVNGVNQGHAVNKGYEEDGSASTHM